MMHVYVIVMVAQFVFLFLAGKKSKPSILLYKNTNRQQFSMVCTLLDYRNDGKLCSESKPRSSSQHSMQRIYYQKISAVPNIPQSPFFFQRHLQSNCATNAFLFFCSSFLSLCSSIFSILLLRQHDFLDCWTPEQKPCLMALFYSNGCKFRSPYSFKKPSRTIYKAK